MYTSSLITAVNATGEQIGPGIMSHNADLDPNGKNRNNVRAYCKQSGLSPMDIFFVPSTKGYHKEDRASYQSFLGANEPWDGHRILTDKSTIFSKGGDNIFLDIGFDQHVSFTPSIHGPMSINDGLLHPVAKAKWRSQRDDSGPQWERTLLLASLIIQVPREKSEAKWKANFFLDSEPTMAGVENILWKKESKHDNRHSYWEQCLVMYEEFVEDFVEDVQVEIPKNLETEFDGKYWTGK